LLRADVRGAVAFSILIVDDDEDQRDLLRVVLSDVGYHVHEAEDGAVALRRLREESFDLVISDLAMPLVDGEELLASLRDRGDKTPFIVLSATGSLDWAVALVRAGATTFLEKPVDARRLRKEARDALAPSRAAREAASTDSTIAERRGAWTTFDAPMKTIGRYEVKGRIGGGAMGEVYLAADPVLGREVAIKCSTLPRGADAATRQSWLERFHREAQVCATLRHPNIAGVYDFGECPTGPYLVMEYVDGSDLRQILADRGALPIGEALELTHQLASALAAAHHAGVAHRDLKPANVLIDREGQARLIDFGVAGLTASDLTATGELVGSPHFMSPEAVKGEATDHTTDQFSLGAMMLTMLTGKKPFGGANLLVLIERICNAPSPTLAASGIVAPQALEAFIARLMAKAPADRFPDDDALAEALDVAATRLGLTLGGRRPSMIAPVRRVS